MKHSAFILAALVFLSTAVSYAQPSDRSFIREQISSRGGCRNVAITCTNGDLMLYGRNGWAANYCPKALTDALNEVDFDVYRVKIAGTAWFISDNSDENYDYIM